MKLKGNLLIIGCLLISHFAIGQLMAEKKTFTREDSLRGSLNENRDWWNVLHYGLSVTPDIESKSLKGVCSIHFKVEYPGKTMQIDLQSPMVIDSVTHSNTRLEFQRQSVNTWLVNFPNLVGEKASIIIYYHGTPKEAKNAPWDGGLVWKKDKNGAPFIATACQGLGASAWWPCKDHQTDEPDNGMDIGIVVPDTLKAISNGRLAYNTKLPGGLSRWDWQVKNPINTYAVTMNIGKYTNWVDTLQGEGGVLDLSFWALEQNVEKAKAQFEQAKPMLHCFEYWFGKYPFYEDTYKMVEAPFLGMEHQSAIAYGNGYQNGYAGRDLSGTGWGTKWDFIIIHESGHEWFGNNITTKDIADMWVHEGFTNYSEALYTQWLFGKEAGDEYVNGLRRNIRNDRNIIGYHGVSKEGSGDMYYKAANMIHFIRNVMNDDEKFRNILRGLNKDFYHQTVTGKQVEDYIIEKSGVDFTKLFDQYLRTTNIPVLEYHLRENGKKVYFRWANTIEGFNIPLVLKSGNATQCFTPSSKWTKCRDRKLVELFREPSSIEKLYYIKTRKVSTKP